MYMEFGSIFLHMIDRAAITQKPHDVEIVKETLPGGTPIWGLQHSPEL